MSISESYSLFLSTQYTCFIIIIIIITVLCHICHISFPFNFSFYFLNIFIQKGFDILCLLILCTNKSLWIKVFFTCLVGANCRMKFFMLCMKTLL